ncbi:hypothetical protein NSQ59_04820 [Margalitia sp. FSL K6-0131]|uniref:hypothetical protein n=1 Tax=Margalitia sp. FSL K6-0131 TaxID=2954604 RepID=UPI0030F9A515
MFIAILHFYVFIIHLFCLRMFALCVGFVVEFAVWDGVGFSSDVGIIVWEIFWNGVGLSDVEVVANSD